MKIETTQDLLSLIRKEAAIAFDLKDAALQVTLTANRLCQAIGTLNTKEEGLRTATQAHAEARKNLSLQYARLMEHTHLMNEAAK